MLAVDNSGRYEALEVLAGGTILSEFFFRSKIRLLESFTSTSINGSFIGILCKCFDQRFGYRNSLPVF